LKTKKELTLDIKRMDALEKYLDVTEINEISKSTDAHCFYHTTEDKEYMVRTQEECVGYVKYVLHVEHKMALYSFDVISEILNDHSYKASAMKIASKYTSSSEERLEKAFFEITSNF
jgi:hypothetical protein